MPSPEPALRPAPPLPAPAIIGKPAVIRLRMRPRFASVSHGRSRPANGA